MDTNDNVIYIHDINVNNINIIEYIIYIDLFIYIV